MRAAALWLMMTLAPLSAAVAGDVDGHVRYNGVGVANIDIDVIDAAGVSLELLDDELDEEVVSDSILESDASWSGTLCKGWDTSGGAVRLLSVNAFDMEPKEEPSVSFDAEPTKELKGSPENDTFSLLFCLRFFFRLSFRFENSDFDIPRA